MWAPAAGMMITVLVEIAKRSPSVPLNPEQQRVIQGIVALLSLACAVFPQVAGLIPTDGQLAVATFLTVFGTSILTYFGVIKSGGVDKPSGRDMMDTSSQGAGDTKQS